MKTAISVVRGLPVEVEVEPILAWRSWTLTGRRDGEGLLLRPVTRGLEGLAPTRGRPGHVPARVVARSPQRRLQLRSARHP